jgi:hypothetical protein
MNYIFAYGSNMNLEDLKEWLDHRGFDSGMILNTWVAVLDHYDFVWNYFSGTRQGGAANLESKIGSSVCGLLIEFKNPELLRAIDTKEGHPTYYSRGSEPITVTRADGQEVDAWLYTARGNRAGRIDIWPTREYKEIVVSGAEKAGLPEDHIQKLKNWPTVN